MSHQTIHAIHEVMFNDIHFHSINIIVGTILTACLFYLKKNVLA